MSVSRLFTIIGDSNVRRNMTGLNVASRESMKKAQVIDFNGVTPLSDALNVVKKETNVCIVAALTDSLVANGDCGTIFASIDPVLTDICHQLSSFCVAHPTMQVPIFLFSSLGFEVGIKCDVVTAVSDQRTWFLTSF